MQFIQDNFIKPSFSSPTQFLWQGTYFRRKAVMIEWTYTISKAALHIEEAAFKNNRMVGNLVLKLQNYTIHNQVYEITLDTRTRRGKSKLIETGEVNDLPRYMVDIIAKRAYKQINKTIRK